MADFPIIADVSNQLMKQFRESLCPETIPSAEAIQMVAPTDKNADYQIGLYLYDVQDLHEYRSSEPVRVRGNVKTLPPKPLNLFYLLFVNSKAQIAASAEVEQRILGKVMQTLYDSTEISLQSVASSAQGEESVTTTVLSLSFEDKSKIWASMNLPYQLGVYFSVSPVLLSSRKAEVFTRVTEVEIRT